MEFDELKQRSAPTQVTAEVFNTVDPGIINFVERNLFGLLLQKIENIYCTVKVKEKEIAILRKKFRMLSAYWGCKIKDLETKASSS